MGYAAAGCPEPLVLPLDLLAYESHASAVQTVMNKFGVIDFLVNNGGRSQRAVAEETALAVDQGMLALNVIGKLPLIHILQAYSAQAIPEAPSWVCLPTHIELLSFCSLRIVKSRLTNQCPLIHSRDYIADKGSTQAHVEGETGPYRNSQ